MILHFFHIAFRNLRRSKGFSILNIAGLAIGMASAMMILLWVRDEMNYDATYKNSDRLYQAWNRSPSNEGIHCWNNTMKILGPTLKKDYPEVEQSTRVNWNATILFGVGEKKLNAHGTMADPDFLTMFDFPFLQGNNTRALDQPQDIVLVEKLSHKLFGSQDPMGKTIRLDNKYNFNVTGVIKDLPANTQFDFEFVLPWSFMRTINEDDSSWDRNSTHNFVLLKKGTDINVFNKKIAHIISEHGVTGLTQSFLYPVSRLHLYSNFENGIPTGGKIEMVRIFMVIAAFILLIACINFMNMSTARSEMRAKEIGIRKVSGAMKKSLVFQFIAESILVAVIAGLLALLLVTMALPAFNTLTKKHILIEFGNFYHWLGFAGFIVFTGVLSGLYPAFFLSSFKPVAVLKGNFKQTQAPVNPRKILVVTQFSFAIILIVSTIVIGQQLKYARSRELGYNKNKLLYVPLAGDITKNYSIIKQELLSQNIITAATKTSAPITERWSNGGADWDGKDPNDRTGFDYYNVDGSIVKTAGLQLLQGRDIDLTRYPTDSNAVLLNEAAVRAMGFKDPLGKLFNKGEWNTSWHVVGVIKDFILQSPYEPVDPMIIQGPNANWFNMIHMKLSDARPIDQNIALLEKTFKKYNPQYPFEFRFIDEEYAKKFSDDQTTGTLSALFAGLTIFISCLGLFGLAAFMAQKRVKEIGVRKVLGASVSGLAALLSGDFIKLVMISIFIASPLAWWVMHKWLSGFTYRTPFAWWVIPLAGCSAITIALITVSFQAVRAAMANPVESLRSE